MLIVQACTESGAPKGLPEFETTGSGVSHASTGAFSNVTIPAGTTMWFNSQVRYSGLPNQVVRLYSSGGRITFSAGGVTYNLVVPDAVVTIDSRTTASTSFAVGLGRRVSPFSTRDRRSSAPSPGQRRVE